MRVGILCVAIVALLPNPRQAMAQSIYGQLTEVDRLIKNLREQQARNTSAIQMLSDGTAVVAPFGWEGEDGTIHAVGEGINSAGTWFKDVTGVMVKTEAVIDTLTRIYLLNELSKPDPGDLSTLRKRAATRVLQAVTQLKRSQKVNLARFRAQQDRTNAALARVLNRRDALELRIKQGGGSEPPEAVGGDPVPSAAWSRVWSSSWGDMTFQISGSHMTGTFTHKDGKLEGDISSDGRRITGKWTQLPSRMPPYDAGAFVFDLSMNRSSFTGRWWYGLDMSKNADGGWTASAK